MKTRNKLMWYATTVYVKSMFTLGALSRGKLGKVRKLLSREEGQGTLEYVMLLSGVAIVLAVIFGIFVSIRNRAQRTQQAIDALPQP
jgi:ABC-type sulfate transport system permease component